MAHGKLPEAVRTYESRRVEARRTVARVGGDQPTLGLALSGGGIRAATIGLGVIQSMMEHAVMPFVDYLSSVSGGGYIAGCLMACWSRKPPTFKKGEDDQLPFLNAGVISHLRTHGSYLIPHGGVLGRDTLRAIGAIFTSVMWSLLFFGGCMIAVAAAIHALLNFLGSHALVDAVTRGTLSVTTLTLAQLTRSLGEMPAHYIVGAITAAATFLLVFARNSWIRRVKLEALIGDRLKIETELLHLYSLCFGGSLLCLAAWRRIDGSTVEMEESLSGLLVPVRFGFGWFGSAILVYFATSFLGSFRVFRRLGGPMRRTYAARSLRDSLVGVTGVLFASTLLLVVVVILWSTLPTLKTLVVAGGGLILSRAITVVSKLKWNELPPAIRTGVTAVAPALVLAVTLLAGLIAALTISDRLLHLNGVERVAAAICSPGEESVDLRALFGCALLIVVAGLLGYVVNLNIFSPHSFYRDRLADTFLTAPWPPHPHSHMRDPRDVRLKDLLSAPIARSDTDTTDPQQSLDGESATSAAPYPIINCAVNLSGSTDLTWRDRKSDLFIFSPGYCGSAVTGFVPTNGFRDGLTTLATAMAISGAAANSGMGYLTSPVLAFFVTLFNLRLGYWLPSPLFHGTSTWVGTTRTPRQPPGVDPTASGADEGLVYWPKWILQEAFASVKGDSELINVSDGGHTGDNLGIYALLQRRLRLVIAVDSGCDPTHGFQDLMAAIHQIEMDEGVLVDIRLDDLARDAETGRVRKQFAIGKITYPERRLNDGHDADTGNGEVTGATGWLVYIKSSLHGDEPENALCYKSDNPLFPHQSTGDQFFDERQFDAYRSLGRHLMNSVCVEARTTVGSRWEGSDEEMSAVNLMTFAEKYFHQARAPAPMRLVAGTE